MRASSGFINSSHALFQPPVHPVLELASSCIVFSPSPAVTTPQAKAGHLDDEEPSFGWGSIQSIFKQITKKIAAAFPAEEFLLDTGP